VLAARRYDSFGANPAILSEWFIAFGVEVGLAPFPPHPYLWWCGASQGLFWDGLLWRHARVSILSTLQQYLKTPHA